jgi:acetyl-CoA carboxylase biotin carboxyl carrier protein
MNLEEIEKLVKLLENSSLSYLEVEENGVRIRLDKNSGAKEVVNLAPSKEEAKNVSNVEENKVSGKEITAPLVGTFHSAPYKDAKPFVSVGQKVKKGQKLCIVEAMKVMNEITSPYDGTILEILAKENDVVEFGKTLFIIGD